MIISILIFISGLFLGCLITFLVICLTGNLNETICVVINKPEDFNLADIEKIRDQLSKENSND